MDIVNYPIPGSFELWYLGINPAYLETGLNLIGTLFGSSANAWAYLIIGIVGIINAIIVFVDKD